MCCYLKIVFGIKHKYVISNVLHIFKQQRLCNILVSEHNASDVDYCCERLDVHYHALAEFINGESKIEGFVNNLSPYCQYIKETLCDHPVDHLAYITLPPKRTIYQAIVFDSSKLLEYIKTAHTASIQSEVMKRKMEKRYAFIEQNNDVVNLVEFILKTGCHDNNMISRFKKTEPLCTLLKKKHCKPVIEAALNISRKIILNSSILTLSDRLEMSQSYLPPEESAAFVKNWCKFQKLDPKEFTKNIIQCLDKKGFDRCSIYLQGSANSGKTYIVQSIIDACIHVARVICESSAYPFVWEKCVDKRLIVIHESHFSSINFDQLDRVLAGSGTLVYKHNDIANYMLPTPVIILANEHVWSEYPELDVKIKERFICSYTNLKPYHITTEKKLHPRWLNLLYEAFLDEKSSASDQKSFYKSSLSDNKTDYRGVQEENSRNTNKDSASMKASTLDDRKHPLRDNEHGGCRKKMRSGM